MTERTKKKAVTQKKETAQSNVISVTDSVIQNPIAQTLESKRGFVDFSETVIKIKALPSEDVKKAIDVMAKDLAAKDDRLDGKDVAAALKGIRSALIEEKRPKRPYEVDPEPWPEDVNLLDVVREVEALIRRVMYLRPECVSAVAYFCVATWFVECVDYAPYMVVTSPAKRCGKSTLLELMLELVKRPYVLSGKPTEAVLFRLIEKHGPTLLVDEVDTFLKNVPELQGLLNGGIKRKLAFISRTESTPSGAKYIKDFSTFGFKVFSGIGAQGAGAALVDRAIVISVERKEASDRREKLRDIPEGVFMTLKRKMCRLVSQYGDRIQALKGDARPVMPDAFGDRDCDKWELICALADIAGADEGRRMRDVALAIANERGEDHWTVQLLADAGAVVDRASTGGYNVENGGINIRISIGTDSKLGDYILSATLHSALTMDSEKPWIDFSGGRPISKSRISKTLSNFGAKPVVVRSQSNNRGFRVSDIKTAVKLYAPDVEEQ